MKITLVNLAKLKPNEYNPRRLNKKTKKELETSLNKFGLVEPIIVNKHIGRENVIVGGHQRYYILKELGKEEIPVVYVNLTLEQEQELNLRLNKNQGQWDWDLLANFEEKLLKDVGFDIPELEILKGEFLNISQPEIDENTLSTQHQCPKCGYEW